MAWWETEAAGRKSPASVLTAVFRDYLTLTKPRIVLLLLFTALVGMFLASGGPPDFSLAAVVLVAGALASGGANALNHFLDRDIDARMRRTSRRPVAAQRVRPREALLFGFATNVIAFVLFATLVNLLSATLALSSTLFYVFVYTMNLKRTTPQNIVIGGAAGALPPVIGWTAVTGSLALPAFYLFAIVFFWTPPHFWALSLLLKDDYASVGVPMLPVVMGVRKDQEGHPPIRNSASGIDDYVLRHWDRRVDLSRRSPGSGVGVRVPRRAADEESRHPGGPSYLRLFPRLPCAAIRRHSRGRFSSLTPRLEG